MSDNKTNNPKPGLFSKLLCKHNWIKRQNWYQPDRSSGKVAWKCSLCGKIIKKPRNQMM